MTRALARLAALLLALVALPIAAQERLGRAIAIEDPTGQVLPRVHAALERAGRGEGVARLAFWGGSHTASDQYTAELRTRLQRRFGDGGLGLVMPARPFSDYERRDAELEASAGWRGVVVRGNTRAPGAYGMAGMAIESNVAGWARVHASRASSHVEAWAAGHAEGGNLALRVDGNVVAERSTRGADSELALSHDGAARRVEVRVEGGPVRLFGLLLTTGRPGVIVDSFGVPGARARDQLPWSEASMAAQVSRHPPDLVTLAYGTNESGDRRPLAEHERDLRAALARWKRLAPAAACLVIGPSDWPLIEGGQIVPRPRTTAVRDAYRRAAFAEGCGFFDLVAFQGGPGSIVQWMSAGMALGDRVHLTDEGHARLGEVLTAALAPPRSRERSATPD